jgi:hypothetical protein
VARRLTDGHAGERVERIRARLLLFPAVGFMLVVLLLALWKKGHIGGWTFALLLAATPFVLYGMTALLLAFIDGTGSALAGALYSTAGDGHSREYSEQQALVAAGRISDAIDSYRTHMVAFPGDVEARLRLASLLAGPAAQQDAGERLLLETRDLPLSSRQETVIGNTLIDLYERTGERHLLKAELARFARLHHGTEAAVHARRHLRQLVEEDHRVT